VTKTQNDLYGNVPDKSPVALLLIDVINDLDFPEADSLFRHALPMAKKLAALKARAEKHRCAIIYVNDNFGRWQSDFGKLVAHCLGARSRGRTRAWRARCGRSSSCSPAARWRLAPPFARGRAPWYFAFE